MPCPIPMCDRVVVWDRPTPRIQLNWLDDPETHGPRDSRRSRKVVSEIPAAGPWQVWKFCAVSRTAETRISDYARLLATIRASSRIADIADNWDGEGSPGYAAATVGRATRFLRGHWIAARRAGLDIGFPRINPADSGSLDVYWSKEDRDLLVNFPSADGPATYFGRDAEGNTFAGEIAGEKPRLDLIAWLGQKK